MNSPQSFVLLALVLPFSALAPAQAHSAMVSSAAQESVEALIAKGRMLLDAGKAAEALPVFEQAAQADKDSLRTRLWVVRTWLALGRTEDALAAVDELQGKGAKGPELDYLFGMSFFLSAQRDVAAGTTSSVTGAQFDDAVRFLSKATEKDDERFRDAHAALAEAAWFTQDLELARKAVERAVKLAPTDGGVQHLRGRIAMSQYVVEKDDEAKKASAEGHWQAAVDAFQSAAKLLAAKGDAPSVKLAADARVQLGNAYMWKQQKNEAKVAYADAIGLDPDAAPFQQIFQSIGGENFIGALEAGREGWKKHHTGASAADATLSWWLGYAYFDQKRFEESEKAFEDAVKKNPAFTNSWYYIFRARYDRRDFEHAVEALKHNHEIDAPGLVASLNFDRDLNLARLDYLVGWCVDEEKHPGAVRNLDAAFLSEVSAAVAPETARYYNNLGLFLRDEGDVLRGTNNGALDEPTKKFDAAVVAKLWERAYEAYRKSLELEPENPGYLNDTAVMLHYYLVRDLPEAKALYEKSHRRAEEELARPDLSPDLRSWFETAKRDSGNNLRLLEELMEKLAREKAGGGN